MSVAYLRYERCTSLSNGRFSKKTRRSILQGGVPDPATGSLPGRVEKKTHNAADASATGGGIWNFLSLPRHRLVRPMNRLERAL